MAIINKTGITDGGTIQSEHVTRAIDALSGGSTDSIIATGSFTGSFIGNGSGLTGITSTSASFATTASFSVSSSQAVSSSFATTASYALNAAAASSFPFTGSAIMSGSLTVTGSFKQSIPGEGMVINSYNTGSVSKLDLTHDEIYIEPSNVSFGTNAELNLSNVNKGAGFRIPTSQSNAPLVGSMYFDAGVPALYIYDGTQWVFTTLGT